MFIPLKLIGNRFWPTPILPLYQTRKREPWQPWSPQWPRFWISWTTRLFWLFCENRCRPVPPIQELSPNTDFGCREFYTPWLQQTFSLLCPSFSSRNFESALRPDLPCLFTSCSSCSAGYFLPHPHLLLLQVSVLFDSTFKTMGAVLHTHPFSSPVFGWYDILSFLQRAKDWFSPSPVACRETTVPPACERQVVTKPAVRHGTYSFKLFSPLLYSFSLFSCFWGPPSQFHWVPCCRCTLAAYPVAQIDPCVIHCFSFVSAPCCWYAAAGV